jgi:exosortase C (VPDSG-CTERM-specific)
MIDRTKLVSDSALAPPSVAPAWADLPRASRMRLFAFAAYAALVTVAFGQTLFDLVRWAFQSEMHSHLPLIPFISAYLVYIRPGAGSLESSRSIAGASVFVFLGIAALVLAIQLKPDVSSNDHLTLMIASYLAFIVSGVFLFFGGRWVSANVFPLAFLIFMVPLPDTAVYWLERASVLASADVSELFLSWTGTPYVRERTTFAVPGFVFQVAQECSGIRSSWVLLITSVLASNFLLGSPWRQVFFVLFVIPLGIARNGFRILVIALLCVYVGPHMVDSVIHRRGGPLFFVLSLIPFFMLLVWLRRREQRHRRG